jgi:hypothetical protein
MLQKTQSLQKNITQKLVFVSYSHRDEHLKDLLMLTFRSLETEGYIRAWHDRMILAGQNWDDTIRKRLESSDLILFLVSEAFLQSGYCRKVEMRTALKRARQKKAYVIPLILSECDWQKERFAKLLALPTDGRPLFKANGALYTQRLQQTVDGLRLALLGLRSYSIDDDPVGASVRAFSSPIAATETVESVPDVELLEPSRPFIPLLIKGLKVSEDTKQIHFLVDTGQSSFAVHSPEYENELKRVSDYFWESLALDEDQQWVNLSPYDSSRMLPEALSGTRLGYDMLAFDCKLKALSASLLHPDCCSGRSYWQELYRRARSRFGTAMLPFQSFQTITVSASMAKVFVPPKSWVPEAPAQAIKDFLLGPYINAAIVVGHKLQAVCDTDTKAEAYMSEPVSRSRKMEPRTRAISDLATAVFRDVILPIIERELNEGESFAFNRQLFVSMILASWLKKLAKEEKLVGERFTWYIDKNRPEPNKFPTLTSRSLTDIGPSATQIIAKRPGDHIRSDDPAFRVTENVLFYQQYLKLFMRGLYRVVRTESGESPGQMIGRVYFSGALDLSGIPISITDCFRQPAFRQDASK